jgi:D-mannonate dehydratase
MQSVKIKRTELLKILRKNREKHIEEYKESVQDYKKAVIKIAEYNLELTKTGKIEEIVKFKHLPSAPKSYENEYDRAIRMLELSVDTVIELQRDVFNQLVLDEWQWKNTFTTTSAIYKSLS